MRLTFPLDLLFAWTLCFFLVAAQRQHFGAVRSDVLVPRYFVDQAFPLAKRANECSQGTHSCEDIGRGDQCCDNSRYCYVNSEGEAKCCAIGSNCLNQNICSSDRFFCTTTITPDSSESPSASPLVRTGCCPRSCRSTSEYRCASSLGGGCCGYDSECRAGSDGGGGRCVQTLRASTTGTDVELTPAAEGCTTSQYRCEDGQGCCDNDQRCTEVQGTGYCAAGAPTGTEGVEPVDADGGDGLSDGAKVGIGVGSVVGAGLVGGVLVWFCMRKRRERRAMTQPGQGSQVGQDPYHQNQAAMTDITATSVTRHQHGNAYIGPHAVAGPYTTDATPGEYESPGSSPGPHRAVPSRPQEPGDIAAAVEMDSNADDGRMSPASASQPSYFTAAVPIHTVEGTFELYSPQSEHAPPYYSSDRASPPAGHSHKTDDKTND